MFCPSTNIQDQIGLKPFKYIAVYERAKTKFPCQKCTHLKPKWQAANTESLSSIPIYFLGKHTTPKLHQDRKRSLNLYHPSKNQSGVSNM